MLSEVVQREKFSPEPIVTLAIEGLSKSYPGVRALQNVSLTFKPGEVHALAGQNGAGKSTLIRILSGAEQPDVGIIRVEGKPVQFNGPSAAQQAGVVTIHQELSLVPRLSVAENIFMGAIPTKGFFIDKTAMRREARRTLDWLGFSFSVDVATDTLSVAQQQAVELAKALRRRAKVILLDEPTATLPAPDVKRLISVLKNLRETGVAIIYVSHRMEELYELCEKASVLRDGTLIGTYDLPQTNSGEIIRSMIGKPLKGSLLERTLDGDQTRPRIGQGASTEKVLSVRGLADGTTLKDISFDLHRGEVLGVAGLVGSGQTELAASLFGSRQRSAGEITCKGHAVQLRSPQEAIRCGLGLLPQDRKTQGFVHGMSVAENMTLASLPKFNHATVLKKQEERKLAKEMIKKLGMRSVPPEKAVGTLSGGTQQKVIFAKWLTSKAQVLIFDEPTRGIDVGAKEEIYELIGAFVREGGSVLMFTSELPEVMMSDRVLVMARGQIVGDLTHEQIDPHGDAILDLFH